jgi:hypothetical protein
LTALHLRRFLFILPGSGWKVAELWTLPAEELLAANEVGVIPWVPLAQHKRRPEALLEECRRRIEQQAHPADQADLLAVSQILAGLRYPNEQLLAILGGRGVMIESPLVNEIVAEKLQMAIMRFLRGRFGEVPQEGLSPCGPSVVRRSWRTLASTPASVPTWRRSAHDCFRDAMLPSD